jgi:phosphate uptake regulator
VLNIESRKLIPFGKFSYVVSLPKQWVKKNKLEKGSDIFLREDQGGLLVTPNNENSKKELKEITISADNKTLQTLKIQIISAYINNYNLITVKSNKKLDSEKVKDIFHSLIAMEVIEQDKSKMVAKDFLNYNDASVANLLKRIDNITRSMIADSIECTDEDNAETVLHRDFDVNRLCYLSQRVIKTALAEPALAKSFKLSNPDLMDTWYVIQSLEKIADASKRVARLCQNTSLTKKEKDLIKSNYKRIQQNFLNIMKAFHTSNVSMAIESLNENKKEMAKIRELVEKPCSKGFTEIVEKLRSIQAYVKRISQIIVNNEGGEQNGV